MRFSSGKNTEQYVEKLDYLDQPSPLPADFTPAPRASLDFYIELDDGTVLDDQIFRIQQFSGQEALSQQFEFNVTLHANTFTSSGQDEPWGAQLDGDYGSILSASSTTAKQISFDNILGSKACIRMGLPETSTDVSTGSYPEDRPVVYFNGIITNFSMAQRGVYQATIKPALFKLTLQNNYRLFSQMTILDVVKQVLSENNIEFNRSEVEASPNKIIRGLATYRKQDWLQAGETDFEFIHRLMQKVHLVYYFIHSNDKHTLVLTDQPYYQTIYAREVSASDKFEETGTIKPMYLSFTKQQTSDRDDYITQFSYQQNLTTTGIKTVLAQKEANWESTKTAQTTPIYLDTLNATEKLNMEMLHVVQYGATESEIETITDGSMNRLTASRFSFSGSATCSEFKAGYKFQVKQRDGEGSGDNNVPIFPTLEDKEFVITSVQHHGTVEGDYSNQFQAVDAGGLAEPFNGQTGNMGSILAQVIDNSAAVAAQAAQDQANSLDTNRFEGSSDKYLQKDVFSYDSKTFYYEDDAESYRCKGIYVRFIDQPETAAPVWVKLAEHMQTIPEVDTFVTIGRSSDDNEIPEVQQSLQAKGSKVIMPEDYTCHTNVGNSYNTNYGDSTSIGFGADVTTSLSVAKDIVETQRDSGNYNSVSYNESSSYGYSVTARSHNISRTGDGADQPDNPSDMMSYVSYGDNATYGDTYNKSKQVGESKSYQTVTGHSYSESTQTGGSTSFSDIDWTTSTSTVGTSTSTSTVGTSTSTNTTTTSTSVNSTDVSANASSTGVSANASFTGMSTSASMTISDISSSMVLTSVGMNIVGASASCSITGATARASITGATTGTDITGVSASTNITGATTSTGITGASSGVNITGASTSVGITGSSTSVNIVGDSTDVSITGSGTSISIVGSGAFLTLDNRTNLKSILTDLEMVSSIKLVL